MKIQLRKPAYCDADAVNKAEGSIRTTAYCEVAPGSPESLARGMLPKGFPRNPGELAISPLARAETRIAKGDRRRLHTDGGAVLRPRSTDEGGEPQGFRKERPRDPLEGRGKQMHVSGERKHRRGSDLDTLCPHKSTEYPN